MKKDDSANFLPIENNKKIDSGYFVHRNVHIIQN